MEDLPDIIRLLNQLWADKFLNPEDVQSVLKRYIEDENYEMYCFEEGKILGIISISKRRAFYCGDKVAIIEDLIVDEQSRGKGIGKELVEFVERELKKEGIKGIELVSDVHRSEAHEFWDKLGYPKSGYQFRKILGKG